MISIRSTLTAGLLLAVLACGGGGGGGGSPTEPPPSPQPQAQTVIIDINDNSYTPKSVVVNAGDTVRWVLRSSTPTHTITELNGAFDSGFVLRNQGDQYERTFTAAESGQTFNYSCKTHSSCCLMRGSIRVGQSAPPPTPGYE
ncbi:MAG TPA: plastocyanin/azurin family copper-binding protein [Thermoanaerobaculia bacterium]|mgnify:CR=1 FL=1|nr:plastocyanin/azurin family copper-binding protein [Thermoanaerobaculia bacterium]